MSVLSFMSFFILVFLYDMHMHKTRDISAIRGKVTNLKIGENAGIDDIRMSEKKFNVAAQRIE